MDNIIWGLRSGGFFAVLWIVIIALFIEIVLFNNDFIFLTFIKFAKNLFGVSDDFASNKAQNIMPTGLVIVPSLLRNNEDYDGIISAVCSSATNGYPNDLFIVISIDGRTECPQLFNKLTSWVDNYQCPSNIHLLMTSNERRMGKMMAIETGSEYMQELVAKGIYKEFPVLYFSVDADSTLSQNALERLAYRLTKPHPLTGNLRRVIAGNTCVHPSEVWQGWRAFFTVRGQIYINAARHFLVINNMRRNWRLLPYLGIPGLLYCTWSDVLLKAPRYMGFIQSIRFIDWLKWLVGFTPPKFSDYQGESRPEALTGNTDDTSIAVLVSIVSWENGKLSFELPRSPLHAFERMIRAWFVEQSHDYDSEAKAYTFIPPTMRGLWLQRVRWNSSRVELTGRFTSALRFHWEIGSILTVQLLRIAIFVAKTTAFYVILFTLTNNVLVNIPYSLFIIYIVNLLMNVIETFFALILETERKKFWRTIYCLPVAQIWMMIFGFAACAYGCIKDIFIFGANVRFVPEWTLIKSKAERIAILYRVRRFYTLCIRSVLYGDVPFGMWWLGWREHHPYVESGFKGWTTGKKASYNLK